MKRSTTATKQTRRMRGGQRGFSLIEVAIASLVLVAGAVAVMQLVPAAMQSNLNNRYDTTSAVTIQRLRDLMVNQVITATTLTDPSGEYPCGSKVTCNLGDSTQNDKVVGAPLLSTGEINFQANPVSGYSFTYTDPNDLGRTQYDVRWAVVTDVRTLGQLTNVVVGKRFVIGARQLGSTAANPVTFVSWVSR